MNAPWRKFLAGLVIALSIPATTALAQTDAPETEMQAPQAEVRGQYQDWIVRCQPAPEDAFGAGELCEMYQSVSESENGQTVFEVVIGYPQGAESPIALFNLPLGIRLPPGVQLQVDDNERFSFPIQTCITTGCRGFIALDQGLETQMRSGAEAVLIIADPQEDRGLALPPLSLSGFSASLNEVEASRP